MSGEIIDSSIAIMLKYLHNHRSNRIGPASKNDIVCIHYISKRLLLFLQKMCIILQYTILDVMKFFNVVT